MAKRTCSIDGCDKIVHARGWCTGHYQRWLKYGDPAVLVNVNRGSGRTVSDGYVKLYRPGHSLANARGWVPEHRLVAYEAGLLVNLDDHVHHRDENKQNNDLSNLEVLTPSEHHRQHSDGGGPAFMRNKTHCKQGHEYTPENTRRSNGRRYCITCERERWHRRTAEGYARDYKQERVWRATKCD